MLYDATAVDVLKELADSKKKCTLAHCWNYDINIYKNVTVSRNEELKQFVIKTEESEFIIHDEEEFDTLSFDFKNKKITWNNVYYKTGIYPETEVFALFV